MQPPRTEDQLLNARRRSVAKAERQDRDQRNREHGPEIFLQVGEPEAAALVCGFVPHSVREQARAAIDWEFHTTLDVVGTTGGRASIEQTVRTRKRTRR
jgi:hypothetical protein